MTDQVLQLNAFRKCAVDPDQKLRNRQNLPGPESIVRGSEGSSATELCPQIRSKPEPTKTDPPVQAPPSAMAMDLQRTVVRDVKEKIRSAMRGIEEVAMHLKSDPRHYDTVQKLGKEIEVLRHESSRL